MDSILPELLVASLLFGGLLLAVELGRRLGIRSATRSPVQAEKAASNLGTIQGALLGLLALLLGFSFAAASARFVERQDYIVKEANAIGTAYLRADLLPSPLGSELKGALRQYVEQRIVLHNAPSAEESPALPEIVRLQDRMWSIGMAGVDAKPSTALLVLPPLNDLFDLHSSRMAVMHRHLPIPLQALLVIITVFTLAVVGFGAGLGARIGIYDRLFIDAMACLVAATLWMTIDLDYPRRGFIRPDITPLSSLHLASACEGGDGAIGDRAA